jgi:hypothetical protein
MKTATGLAGRIKYVYLALSISNTKPLWFLFFYDWLVVALSMCRRSTSSIEETGARTGEIEAYDIKFAHKLFSGRQR